MNDAIVVQMNESLDSLGDVIACFDLSEVLFLSKSIEKGRVTVFDD